MPAVAPDDAKRFEQSRHPMAGDSAPVPAGLVVERAGDPAFPEAGGAGDEEPAAQEGFA